MKRTNREGISLIVLVITIIVLVLLTSIIILNLDLNNTIGGTKKTIIKTELSNLQEAIEEKTMKNAMKRDLISLSRLSDLGIQSDYEEITIIRDGKLFVLNNAENDIKEVAKDKGILARGEEIKYLNAGISLEKFKPGEDIISYRIYGNSVQEVEPTISKPIRIDSVGNREISYAKYKNLYIDTDGFISPDASNKRHMLLSEYIEIEPSTTYVISMNNTYSDETTTVVGAAYDENKDFIDFVYTIERTNTGIYTATFTTPANAKYILINSRNTDNNIKLYNADGKTEYLPSKYKIPVIITGKNIGLATDIYSYNIKGTTGNNMYSEVIEDGRNCVKFLDNINLFYDKIHFKENTQYTIQFDVKTTIRLTNMEKESRAIGVYYSDGTFDMFTVERDIDWTHKTYTTAAGKTVAGIELLSWNYCNWIYIDKDTFQIEEGTRATEYTPYIKPVTFDIYLDAPLRKVGDVADYIDGMNNRVVRNIGVIEKYNGEKIETEYMSTSGSLVAGDTVFYVLDKPVYEKVELPKISIVDKKTMVTVGTKLLPSDIQVDY